ncbi:MAG: four helix bundle protein [Caldilineaceae bacterium]|jgi:four helix bundle protein|nr:four helix bundle protein [Caldilineaceae bacterium]
MGTDLSALESYRMAESLAQVVWGIVERWKPFARQTMGSQLIRAVDSVGANIAESHGRFYFGEKLQFLYYARGSLYETRHWLRLAWRRNLLQAEDNVRLTELLEPLAKSINSFAGSLKQQRTDNKLKESSERYGAAESISNLPISNLDSDEIISKEDFLWLTNFANAS